MEPIFFAYFAFIARLLRILAKRLRGSKVVFQSIGLSITFGDAARESIDQRIEKIDAARANLVEGIRAIDDLKAWAEKNRLEARRAVEQIATLELDETTLREKIAVMQTVLQADVGVIRDIAGVPSQADVQRERYIGFASGVIASSVAGALIVGVTALVRYVIV